MAGENNVPAGDTPPAYFTGGFDGWQDLNEWFGYLTSMSLLGADSSVVITPGTPYSPGRIRATATGGGSSTATTPPLTIVDASGKDKNGTAHPGRVRVYNGKLGNLTPAEMKVPDSVLPDGTDNHCYLTMQSGRNFVRGKVQVATATGLYSAASVYRVATEEPADGTYAYLTIGDVTFDGTKLTISQDATGNQQLFVTFSRDGSIISPIWNPTTA